MLLWYSIKSTSIIPAKKTSLQQRHRFHNGVWLYFIYRLLTEGSMLVREFHPVDFCLVLSVSLWVCFPASTHLPKTLLVNKLVTLNCQWIATYWICVCMVPCDGLVFNPGYNSCLPPRLQIHCVPHQDKAVSVNESINKRAVLIRWYFCSIPTYNKYHFLWTFSHLCQHTSQFLPGLVGSQEFWSTPALHIWMFSLLPTQPIQLIS